MKMGIVTHVSRFNSEDFVGAYRQTLNIIWRDEFMLSWCLRNAIPLLMQSLTPCLYR
jgi:hypothetical protein